MRPGSQEPSSRGTMPQWGQGQGGTFLEGGPGRLPGLLHCPRPASSRLAYQALLRQPIRSLGPTEEGGREPQAHGQSRANSQVPALGLGTALRLTRWSFLLIT